jgi:hypothetical protein
MRGVPGKAFCKATGPHHYEIYSDHYACSIRRVILFAELGFLI